MADVNLESVAVRSWPSKRSAAPLSIEALPNVSRSTSSSARLRTAASMPRSPSLVTVKPETTTSLPDPDRVQTS